MIRPGCGRIPIGTMRQMLLRIIPILFIIILLCVALNLYQWTSTSVLMQYHTTSLRDTAPWRNLIRKEARKMFDDLIQSLPMENFEVNPPSTPFFNESALPFSLKKKRRRNVGWCGAYHSSNAVHMLKKEFGFSNDVDPMKSDKWDLIYGGYPHCGNGNGADPPDWNMKERLNKHLTERGWDNLKPWQVWFPCMGCRTSYCDKRELCKIIREDASIETNCYLLPENRAELEGIMSRQLKDRIWVVKRDAPSIHLHAGKGISYARLPKDLPPKELTEKKPPQYLVMPYVRPFLGSGPAEYRRKSELRIYLAITSVTPAIRLYAYSQAWVVLAGSKYNASSVDKCTHDTHAHSKRGKCKGVLSADQRQLTFEEYAKKVDMPREIRESLLPTSMQLLSHVIHQSTQTWQAHKVNVGIAKSGASCFSYMRADLGISESGKPVIFEINELPYVNEEASQIRPLQLASMRDLFSMIGLSNEPILYGEHERELFEMEHRGKWVRLKKDLAEDTVL